MLVISREIAMFFGGGKVFNLRVLYAHKYEVDVTKIITNYKLLVLTLMEWSLAIFAFVNDGV